MGQSEEDISNFFEAKTNSLESNVNENNETIINNCHYCTENQFIDKMCTSVGDELTLLHFNIRSMNNKIDNLNVFLQNQRSNFTAIGISETWFSSNSDVNLYSLPGYSLVTNSRSGKKGGGVALYVSSQMEYLVRHELNTMNNLLESIFVEVVIPGKRNVIIGVVYRPPPSNLDLAVNEMQIILSNPLFVNKTVFLMGDFNANLLQYDENIQIDVVDNFLLNAFNYKAY